MKSTYTIPEYERETVEKLLARYQRKAQAYGQSISVSFGKPYAKRINVYAVDPVEHCKYKVSDFFAEVFDAELDAQIICKSGYAVVAKLEHMEGGNAVYTLTEEVNPAWHTLPARCEHCGGSHNQLTTFIIRDAKGQEKQVGSTCLKDYTGIDPSAVLRLKELQEVFLKEDVANRDLSDMPRRRVYETVKILALAIRVYKAFGYVNSEKLGSNKEKLERLIISGEEPTVSEMNESELIAKDIVSMELETATKNLLDNVRALLNRGYCRLSHFGFIAYAPLAYVRYNEARKKSEAEASKSYHVGEVGQRLDIELSEMKLLTSWVSDFGRTYVYKFIDKAGCVYIWYASKAMEKTDKIRATVKAHNERDGIKQTIITRCKAA